MNTKDRIYVDTKRGTLPYNLDVDRESDRSSGVIFALLILTLLLACAYLTVRS